MAEAGIERDYEACKDIAVSTYAIRKPETFTVLNNLKEKYREVINSPRAFENINDLRQLIKVLEKRNALNNMDISVLEHIYSVMNINRKILENYKSLIKGKSAFRDRGEDAENQAPYKNPPFGSSTTNYNSEHFQDANHFQNMNYRRQRLSERVVTEISTRIGSSWQDLARYLKVVQECKILQIAQDPSLANNEAKTRAMLLEYERHVDPAKKKIYLVKALELADRRDLREKVEKLFLTEA